MGTPRPHPRTQVNFRLSLGDQIDLPRVSLPDVRDGIPGKSTTIDAPMCAPPRAVPARPRALDPPSLPCALTPSPLIDRRVRVARVGRAEAAHAHRALPLHVGGAHAAGRLRRRAAGAAVTDPVSTRGLAAVAPCAPSGAERGAGFVGSAAAVDHARRLAADVARSRTHMKKSVHRS